MLRCKFSCTLHGALDAMLRFHTVVDCGETRSSPRICHPATKDGQRWGGQREERLFHLSWRWPGGRKFSFSVQRSTASDESFAYQCSWQDWALQRPLCPRLEQRTWVGACFSSSGLAQTEGFKWVSQSYTVFSKTIVEHVKMLEEENNGTINGGVGVQSTKLIGIRS